MADSGASESPRDTKSPSPAAPSPQVALSVPPSGAAVLHTPATSAEIGWGALQGLDHAPSLDEGAKLRLCRFLSTVSFRLILLSVGGFRGWGVTARIQGFHGLGICKAGESKVGFCDFRPLGCYLEGVEESSPSLDAVLLRSAGGSFNSSFLSALAASFQSLSSCGRKYSNRN